MQQIVNLFTGIHWDIVVGAGIIFGMLWWVTEKRSSLKRKRKERMAKEKLLGELGLGADQGLTRFTLLPGQTSKN